MKGGIIYENFGTQLITYIHYIYIYITFFVRYIKTAVVYVCLNLTNYELAIAAVQTWPVVD